MNSSKSRMNIAEISAISVVYELDFYIENREDVNHATHPLPFHVGHAAFLDIHANGRTSETLNSMASILGNECYDETRVGLIVRYVQPLVNMGDMAGYDFAGAVRAHRGRVAAVA